MTNAYFLKHANRPTYFYTVMLYPVVANEHLQDWHSVVKTDTKGFRAQMNKTLK